jgi:gamma-glutamyltranspeptidase/glutathione hydrolase
MGKQYSRREMLRETGAAVLISALGAPFCFSANKNFPRWKYGAVVGENTGMLAAEKILAAGGNAVDAAVAAALAACVAAPSRSGLGGYGGHMIIAPAHGKKIVCIDFNTVAPAAARRDMFPLDEKGAVKNRANFFGWQAMGVPGVPAGLELALKKYGTRTFRQVAGPAIEVAGEGFAINRALAGTLKGAAARFAKDPASARLYLKDGAALKQGDILRNPDLAEMLSLFARENSVESFYRGAIARKIAEAIQKNGGLLTTDDLASYRAREVEPLQLKLRDFTVLTPPLTSGGLTVLQALSFLKALEWKPGGPAGPTAHARLEALRLAWKDRLELFGDPEQTTVPVERLLSASYASEQAEKIRAAVTEQKPINTGLARHLDEGTNNLCAVDRTGNMVAVTLTHGGGFGAQVTVDGLGLTLGHGMSRFDPRPDHPNAPGPRKRPVHNMCPSILLRGGIPVMALGAAGGVRIPNSLFDLLTNYIFFGASMDEAIAAPRLQSTGTLDVAIEPSWPKESAAYLKQIGFKVQTWESSSVVSAVSFDPKTKRCRGALRAPAALEMGLDS